MKDYVESLMGFAPHLLEGAQYASDHVMIRCPFHGGGQENTPSMSLSTWKPVYFCFGCKASGHASQLFRHYGVGRTVIDKILPKTNYTKDETRKGKTEVGAKILRNVDPFRGQFILNEELLDYYRLMPQALKQAGFKTSTLRHFEVGFDNKNLRITFPLRTAFGELVGISGRTILEGIEPRYKIYDGELKERTDFRVPENYSMGEVKSAVLWHAHVVRPMFFVHEAYRRDIIITEGFKACMWTWQSGFEDVVALVGSYLTPTHAELVARATRRVILFLDNNEAGWVGTLKAGRALLKKGVEVCVARYPDEREQPDDLNPDEVLHALDQSESLLKWSISHS